MYCYGCSLALELPDGLYAGSLQEPDLFVEPRGHLLPTFIIACGFSESWSRLQDDVDLWLLGSNGSVNGVLLLKWVTIENSNRVQGSVELYCLDDNGAPVLRQREVLAHLRISNRYFSSLMLIMRARCFSQLLGNRVLLSGSD